MRKMKFIGVLSLIMSVVLLLPVYSYNVNLPEENSAPNEVVISSNGKLTENLSVKFEDVPLNTAIQTSIWIEDIDLSICEDAGLKAVGMTADEWETYQNGNPERSVIKKYIAAKREMASSLYEKYNYTIGKELFNNDEIVYVSKYAPFFVADLTYSRAMELSNNSVVMSIDCSEPNNNQEVLPVLNQNVNLNSVTATATSNDLYANDIIQVTKVHNNYGYNGTGVTIGVLEKSLHTSLYSYDITAINGYVHDSYYLHTNNTLDFLTSIAPNAKYYIGMPIESENVTEYNVIESLLSYGVDIINISYPVGNDQYGKYGNAAKWLDHIAYSHDVHVVMAAGDYVGVMSGAMAYNVITVGNLNHNRTSSYADDIIGNLSTSKACSSLNPSKPDIVAPGTGLNTQFQRNISGTSWACAQVSGVVALMCDQDTRLLTKQDVVKAILACSTSFESPYGYQTQEEGYVTYGSGLLDANIARWVIAEQRWVQSSISSSTVYKTYSMNVTPSDTRMRIALVNIAYSSAGSNHGSGSATTTHIGNLDLEILDPYGEIIYYSDCLYNNVEIVDFNPSYAGTYTIRICNSNSVDANTYYGVAWR